MSIINEIKRKLKEGLSTEAVRVIDNSPQHANHYESEDVSHVEIHVASVKFKGIGLLKQHKMVNDIISDEIKKLHAISIKSKIPKKAIVLLSGGLDSSTVLHLALKQGFEVIAMSFDYKQRNYAELNAAKLITKNKNVEHKIIKIDENTFADSGNSLTNLNTEVENGNDVGDGEIPNTYVPSRNLLFLSHAISCAESHNCTDIFIGVNSVDYGNYPDCRPEFIESVQNAATLSSKFCNENDTSFTIHTPIMKLKKSEIIQLGHKIGVDYSQTVSCYNANDDGLACGNCLSCNLRKKGFEEAEIKDTTRYV